MFKVDNHKITADTETEPFKKHSKWEIPHSAFIESYTGWKERSRRGESKHISLISQPYSFRLV